MLFVCVCVCFLCSKRSSHRSHLTEWIMCMLCRCTLGLTRENMFSGGKYASRVESKWKATCDRKGRPPVLPGRPTWLAGRARLASAAQLRRLPGLDVPLPGRLPAPSVQHCLPRTPAFSGCLPRPDCLPVLAACLATRLLVRLAARLPAWLPGSSMGAGSRSGRLRGGALDVPRAGPLLLAALFARLCLSAEILDVCSRGLVASQRGRLLTYRIQMQRDSMI